MKLTTFPIYIGYVYVYTQPLRHEQDVTQCQFLSVEKLV